MVFGDQKGLVQLLALTTNDFYGIQSFSITSGVSNCTEDGVAMAGRERELFAEANFQDLRQEAAQGQGENIGALAGLYGCHGAEAAFGQALQSNYPKVGLAPGRLFDAPRDRRSRAHGRRPLHRLHRKLRRPP